MAPRKSNGSVAANGTNEETSTTPAPATTATTDQTPVKNTKESIGIDDLTLPKSMIGRLAKGVLPPNTIIAKDALLALHKSATVFVSYIASNANESAQSGGKKTIQPADVLSALKDAELENFIPRLEAELKKYNDTQCDKRNTYRSRVREEKAAAAQVMREDESASLAAQETATNGQTNGEPEDADRPAKKIKASDGTVIIPSDDADQDQMEDDTVNDDADVFYDDDGMDDDDDDDIVVDPEDDEDIEDEADVTVENGHDDTTKEARAPDGMRDEALDEPDSD